MLHSYCKMKVVVQEDVTAVQTVVADTARSVEMQQGYHRPLGLAEAGNSAGRQAAEYCTVVEEAESDC